MRIKALLIAGSVSAIALTACTPVDQYSANPNQRTKEGALTGAAIGAGLGILTGKGGKDKLDRAVVGGAIGAAAGGLIGHNLDRQAAELQAQLNDSRIRVVNEGNQLRVVMPNGILFATDSAAVQGSIQNDLYTVADNLNRYPNTRVEVVGHTDNTGSATYNQDLSERRAAAVASILRSAGVSGGRIASYGRGESAPVASNLTADGQAQNRRVEILIIPTG
ncbi:outer membrane protein OmpA-like peptidoglycan-associated protein [Defluviimonas denitrificans]|jgi:outer membrane protein OmpA-like peptidoglycan-associated protein|uniref:Outer membrane protein OmpA-like peptidoglycan-associated protein n=1 Tax=Albidovulum denitrificans TaxID=404881 RepID=A0A2S8S840_9RHOB|nr:OmpA family protein [Defluviimonas denitrificans]PQV56954.1 outer membrane protein OmpA-like peptidoglycan-associated protein [Defluviimonas denitrificans]